MYVYIGTVIWEFSIRLIFVGQGYPRKYFNTNVFKKRALFTILLSMTDYRHEMLSNNSYLPIALTTFLSFSDAVTVPTQR